MYKWSGLTLAEGQLPPNHSPLVSDSSTGIEPLPVTPVLLVRHSEIAYSCAPSPGLSHSDEPSAASWSLALYTNATSQTGRRPFAWVIQLLAVSLKDENLLLADHPSQVMMQMHPDPSGQLCSRATLG